MDIPRNRGVNIFEGLGIALSLPITWQSPGNK